MPVGQRATMPAPLIITLVSHAAKAIIYYRSGYYAWSMLCTIDYCGGLPCAAVAVPREDAFQDLPAAEQAIAHKGHQGANPASMALM